MKDYEVRPGTRTGRYADAPETYCRVIRAPSRSLHTWIELITVSVCSAPRLSPALTAMIRQDQSRRLNGTAEGTV